MNYPFNVEGCSLAAAESRVRHASRNGRAEAQVPEGEKRRRKPGGGINRRSNSGMHPTGFSGPLIESLRGLAVVSRRVMPGVRLLVE